MKSKIKKNPNRIIQVKSIFNLKPLFGKKKKSPVNFKLFPGSKIRKSFYPTDQIVPSMGMSIDQFNEKTRKERRQIYKTKLQ